MALTQNSYQRLGAKTLALFVISRSQPFFVGVIVFVGTAILNPYLQGALGGQFTEQQRMVLLNIVNLAGFGGLGIAGIGLALSLIIGWFEYITYQFELGENALRIVHGIFYKEEVAIPYRQIQNVNIVRDLFYQIVGLSKVVILTGGDDDGKPDDGDDPEGILPALDNDLARDLQEELLKRADVERVAVMPK